jgi:thymidylate synthase
MKQYLNLLQDILDNGQREPNRTGIDTLTLPGAMLKFDLRDGFPAVTTKKLAFKQVVGELIGFLRGYTSAADFRAVGCTVWDQNANENKAWLASPFRKGVDDLGRIYGQQWRRWRGDNGNPNVAEWDETDQIAGALDQLRNNPESRRIIVTAWNPSELTDAALPPCHHYFQLLPRSDGTLHMVMGLRSSDGFLGLPFNIASYALLLELFAAWSGRTAATLTMFLADAHIYVNHVDQVKEQLGREPLPLPKLWLEYKAPPTHIAGLPIDVLVASLDPAKIHLMDYQSHAAIKAPMAV